MKPHGHKNYRKNSEKCDFLGLAPCVYCGKACPVSAVYVGVHYRRSEQPWMTTDDPAMFEVEGTMVPFPDIVHPIGSACLKKLKKVVPNLALNPDP